jgi:hypothetical protein
VTNQECFDGSARHLLTQMKRCSRGSECLYRFDGMKCAIGVLIPDEIYRTWMENRPIRKLLYSCPDLKTLFCGVDESLLIALQDVHDASPLDKWAIDLRAVADRYHLDASVLDAERVRA